MCRCPTNIVCGRAHRGSICGFLVFLFQIALESFALFRHGGVDYTFKVDSRYLDLAYLE